MFRYFINKVDLSISPFLTIFALYIFEVTVSCI